MVRDFLTWYVPKVLNGKDQPAFMVALKQKNAWFTPVLVQALRKDLDEAAKIPDEVAGLDGDPFLDAQDFCERYEVGRTTQQGDRVLVEIVGICQGKRHPKADSTAELIQQNGKWVFADFRYPEGGGLLSVLKELDDERKKMKSRR